MSATYPVASGVLRGHQRYLMWWAIAVVAVTIVYVGYYPLIGEADIQTMVDSLPEGLVKALGYDTIGTAAGYIGSTVYGLLGPALLLIFAIAGGARLIAGQEEDGTLELELTAPIAHRRQYGERILAMWLEVALLAAIVGVTTAALAALLDLSLSLGNLLAATVGLFIFAAAFGTLAYAIGAATGRRAIALGVAAACAVAAFMLNAIGPSIDSGWMTAVSPMSWYMESDPLLNGWDVGGLALLAVIPVVAGIGGLALFRRRDLMV